MNFRYGYLPVQALSIALALALVATFAAADDTHDPDRSHYLAPWAEVAPEVDGVSDDAAWSKAAWRAIDNVWLGGELSDSDFSGRYKVVWTEDRLYVLVEFVDDVLVDFHRDPLEQYWDDDCLEIFIDEDFSGGDHQYNHNAFAYHLSLDNQAIDIGTDRQPRSYTDHVESRWRQTGEKVTWEVSIQVYTDEYVDEELLDDGVADLDTLLDVFHDREAADYSLGRKEGDVAAGDDGHRGGGDRRGVTRHLEHARQPKETKHKWLVWRIPKQGTRRCPSCC